MFAGWRCERCKAQFFGDPSSLGCEACLCDILGSGSQACDNATGQCACKERFTGRTCDKCQVSVEFDYCPLSYGFYYLHSGTKVLNETLCFGRGNFICAHVEIISGTHSKSSAFCLVNLLWANFYKGSKGAIARITSELLQRRWYL